MSCCSTSSVPRMCPSRYAVWFPRIAFGMVLLGYGVNHFRTLSNFVQYAQEPFVAFPALAGVVAAFAYVVPALMIAGGILFAMKLFCPISKVCILVALSGIISWAGLGILVNTDQRIVGMLGGSIQSASVLLILFFVIKKMSKCSGGCASSSASSCCSSHSTH